MRENNIENENLLSEGQVITIPRLEGSEQLAEASASPETSPSPEQSPTDSGTALTPEASPDQALSQASPSPEATSQPAQDTGSGTGGAENQTIWGEKITGDTYTVQAGDWLSTIAGRAYGDILQYQKIAEANNITNPDVIEVGTVLKLPR
jgi:5'-nucleotidase / UDP-sugar diphosphatase